MWKSAGHMSLAPKANHTRPGFYAPGGGQQKSLHRPLSRALTPTPQAHPTAGPPPSSALLPRKTRKPAMLSLMMEDVGWYHCHPHQLLPMCC